MSCILGNKKKNLEKINLSVHRASDKGANPVVFPELFHKLGQLSESF